MGKTSGQVFLLAVFGVGVASAGTLTYNFNGNFTYDNDVVLFNVVVQNPAYFSVYSTSWAAGGFEPHLELYDGAGTTQFAVSNGGLPACPPAPLRGGTLCGDAEVHAGPGLAPGPYLVALSQVNNYSDGFDILNPFSYSGAANQNYTAVPGVCDSYFCDSFFLTPNSSAWALTFEFTTVSGPAGGSVTISGVPEPSTGAMVIGALAVLGGLRRVSRRHRDYCSKQ